MKPTLIYRLLSLALAFASIGCVVKETTRPIEGGGKEVIQSYGLSERAGSFADAYARYRLRMPQDSLK